MTPATLPAPIRQMAGLALIGLSLGFTGLLSIVHILVEILD